MKVDNWIWQPRCLRVWEAFPLRSDTTAWKAPVMVNLWSFRRRFMSLSAVRLVSKQGFKEPGFASFNPLTVHYCEARPNLHSRILIQRQDSGRFTISLFTRSIIVFSNIEFWSFILGGGPVHNCSSTQREVNQIVLSTFEVSAKVYLKIYTCPCSTYMILVH